MYISRTLERFFLEADRHFPVLLVTGARQVGKTSMLQHLQRENMRYVTLDDPLILSLAKEDAALFMQRFEPPVIIDEIQYAPELLPYIKIAADKSKQPGMFWLTGSQQFHLMRDISESLAGRIALLSLLGLSRREMLCEIATSTPFLPTPEIVQARLAAGGQLALNDAYRLMWRGSLPRIALDNDIDRDLFYSSYVQTYLQRDVRDLARVGDEMAFLRFLKAAAARTGQMLNMAELARDADIAPNTAKSWLSILETSGIIYLLAPYAANLTKRLVKRPKLYFFDTGLCSFLTGWSSPETLEAGAMSGAIFETWVIGELLKSYLHNGRQPVFYYYRDKDKKEIDLLIIQDNIVYPLEIKKSATPTRYDVRHFRVLDRLPLIRGQGGIICLTQHLIPLAENIAAIPAAAL